MNKRVLLSLAILGFVLLVLTVGIGAAQEGAADQAEEPEAPDAVVPGAIPIQGRLTDASGTPLNGIFSMTFSLYEAASGGVPICNNARSVTVTNGLFSDYMDNCYNDIYGQKVWLGVKVGGDPEMTPRQVIYPVPYAVTLMPGAEISATLDGLPVVHIENSGSTGRGLRVYATDSTSTNYAIVAASKSPAGYGGYLYNNGGGVAMWGWSNATDAPAIFGCINSSSSGCTFGTNPAGVLGKSSSGDGVQGITSDASRRGVYAGNTANGVALAAVNDSADTTNHWVPTLYLVQANANGDYVVGARSYFGTRDWRVDRTGKGFFNGGTQTTGADFAEQIAVAGDEEEYKPGDVLVISPDGDRLAELSTKPFSTAVLGVYSDKPGYLAGAPDTNDPLAGLPVAIVGIVRCKVTAENGPIQRGDLLVTSATPGHAMRAGENPPQGSVLGKALQALPAGAGEILILVTLQ